MDPHEPMDAAATHTPASAGPTSPAQGPAPGPGALPAANPAQMAQWLELQQQQLAAQAQQQQMLMDAVQALNQRTESLQLPQQLPPLTSTLNFKPLRFKDPETFHGKRSEDVTSWTLQVSDYLDFAAVRNSDTERVAYAAQLLRGNARMWWQAKKEDAAKGNTVLPTTWEQLRAELLREYLPINDARLARDQLANLRQTGSVQALVYQYRALCLRIKDMSDSEKLDRFLRALKAPIQKELEIKEVSTFEEACTLAERIDRITYADRSYNASKGRYHGNHRSGSDYSSRHASSGGPTPMELGAFNAPPRRDPTKSHFRKLTPEEREELRRTGRCFYCRQPNHRALDCPSRPKQDRSKGNGRAR